MNTEPLPGSLVTVTSPPIMRASLRVMARPRPVPPKRCAVVLSAWVNSSNSFACCSGVMPTPVSETDSSIHWQPSATLRAPSLISPSLVNLQALLNRLSKICRSRMGSTVSTPRFSWSFDDKLVVVLLSELTRGADDLVDQRRKLDGLRIEFELAGLDLGEIEHLVDEAEEMVTSAVHALQGLQRLFRAEARRVGDHHLGQTDDGVEGRAEFMAHPGDELRLILARLLQLSVLLLDFLEQPDVLDRDHRLVGKCRNQLDLLVRERTYGRLAKLNTPIGTRSRISGTPRMVRTPPLRSIASNQVYSGSVQTSGI